MTKSMPLENSNNQTEPTLSEPDRADMDGFLRKIFSMLPVLGIHVFEQGHLRTTKGESPLLTCRGRGVTATGHDTPQGFIVQANSYAATTETPSLQKHFPSVCKRRLMLQKNGVLIQKGDTFQFTQDYTFGSPSEAAEVVIGRASNGRIDWCDENGRTLKQIQQEQAMGNQ